MEVGHQLQPGILDALAEGFDVVEVLTYSLVAAIGVDKQSDTHGVLSLFAEEGQHVGNRIAVLILIQLIFRMLLGFTAGLILNVRAGILLY